MDGKCAADIARKDRQFFGNVLADLKPGHADFRPVAGMMSVAAQVRHVAKVTKWFQEGAFGKGYDMNFEEQEKLNEAPCTLQEALDEFNATMDAWIAFLETQTEAQLFAAQAPNEILGPAPKFVAIHANSDHMAHHRGALTVYLRLLGIKPRMVYM